MKKLFALLFVICLLLSACGKGAPEAGSQPGTSSQPTSSSTGTTAPPTTATTAPPTTAPPIKQEVTPKASFVWNGSLFTDGTWSVLDKKNVEFDFDVPGGLDWLSAAVPEPVYYGGYLTTLLKTAPDDAYYLVIVDTGPADLREYGKPCDASEELDAIEKKNREELHRRMLEAGYIYFLDKWTHDETIGFATIMSVAEMKTLHCGDDLPVYIEAWTYSQMPT